MKSVRIILSILMPLLFAACTYEFDLQPSAESGRPVLYVFPGNRDTIVIQCSRSVPVTRPDSLKPSVSGAEISVWVDGESCPVQWNSQATPAVPKGCYYYVKRMQAGQKVQIDCRLPEGDHVKGETVVPEQIPIDDWNIAMTNQKNSQMVEFRLRFTDKGGKRFYGLRVEKMVQDAWIYEEDTVHYQYIQTELCQIDKEPLLSESNGLEGVLTEYRQYENGFYIWDNERLRGKPYTLKIYTNPERSWDKPDGTYSHVYYRMVFYSLSEPYFRYLESRNAQINNELGDMGFSPVRPDYSNVDGGIGVVGAYQVEYTPWVRL